MRKKSVYVVDDDPDLRRLVVDTLSEYGFAAAGFRLGRDLLAAIRREAPDLCVVDLGLPDMDGLALLRELCGDVRFGVIILSGRGGASDRVLGLELGADDYVTKPFEPRELVARVNSYLRRHDRLCALASPAGPGKAHFAEWTLDAANLTLQAEDGRTETLSRAECDLLMAFLGAPKRVLSRDRLMGDECERDDQPYDRSIDVRISRLRRKLGDDPRSPRLIKTVYGVGYLFTVDVEWRREG